MKIRKALISDAENILEIYKYYILNTAITFEIEIPKIEEFQNRIKNISSFYPYFVLEDNNKIYGYAYAKPYNTRAAFKYDVEISIYIDNNYKNMGYGKLLYNALENVLKEMNVIHLYSAVAYKENDEFITNASIKFHEKLGFKMVGKFLNSGYKFKHWYDLIWLEKQINDYKNIKELINYNNLK